MADPESPLEAAPKKVADYGNGDCGDGPDLSGHIGLTVEPSAMTGPLDSILLCSKSKSSSPWINFFSDVANFTCPKCKLVALLEEKVQQLESRVATLQHVREQEVFLDTTEGMILEGDHTEKVAGGRKARWSKKCVSVALIFSVLASSALVAIISILTKSSFGPCPATTVSSCPSKWVGYEGKCYYFSEVEGNWAFSQSNCSASDASLVAIENQEEMKFIMKHKEPTDYWIGLKREEGQPWKWADGSIFSGWFEIGANGFCAFLDDEKATSTLCSTERNWICSKFAYIILNKT